MITTNRKWIFRTSAGLIGAVLLAVLGMGVQELRTSRALKEAERLLTKNLPAAAAEELLPFRGRLVKDEKGCAFLIAALMKSRQGQRLQWVAEKCLDRAETPEAHIGLAAVAEFDRRDEDALILLARAGALFPKSPEIQYRMADIYRRKQRPELAAERFLKVVRMGGSSLPALVDILDFLGSAGRWTEAREVAERMSALDIGNAEIWLMMARAAKLGGNAEAAKAMADRARQLVAGKPEIAAKLKAAYPEVL